MSNKISYEEDVNKIRGVKENLAIKAKEIRCKNRQLVKNQTRRSQ